MGEVVHVREQELYRKSLYLFLKVAVNAKLHYSLYFLKIGEYIGLSSWGY